MQEDKVCEKESSLGIQQKYVECLKNNFQHYYVSTPNNKKREVLRSLLQEDNIMNAIIFCYRRKDIKIVCRSLIKHNFPVVALELENFDEEYKNLVEIFSSPQGTQKIIVAPSVIRRDFNDLSVQTIINFDIPDMLYYQFAALAKDHVRRIYSLVTDFDQQRFLGIKEYLQDNFQHLEKLSIKESKGVLKETSEIEKNVKRKNLEPHKGLEKFSSEEGKKINFDKNKKHPLQETGFKGNIPDFIKDILPVK